MPLDSRFIVNIKGKQAVMVAGALDLAHQQGLRSIETEPVIELCRPEEDFWVFRATATFRTGDGIDSVWVAYGDASPASSQMKGCYLRHAESRAIGRVCRFSTNLGRVILEELPDEEMDRANGHPVAHGQNASRPQAPAAPRGHGSVPRHPPIPEPAAAAEAVCSVPDCGVVLTPDEVRSSHRHFGGVMCCPAHGRERLLAQRAEAEAAAA